MSSLTCRWGENPHGSLSPMALGPGGGVGGLIGTPILILRYPKSMQEDISTLV
jgi:hypothetical protein